MACNINELMRNLSAADAATFSLLAENEWTMELEAHKYVWRNYDLNEIMGPFDSDEEVVRAARTIYRQITGEDAPAAGEEVAGAKAAPVAPQPPPQIPAGLGERGWELVGEHNVWYCRNESAGVKTGVWADPEDAFKEAWRRQQAKAEGEKAIADQADEIAEAPTQEQVIERLRSRPATERFAPHEIDNLNKVVGHLIAGGAQPRTNVGCRSGVADVVTEDAVFEIKCGLSPENVSEVAARVSRLCDEINPTGDAIIIACCETDSSAATRETAEGMGVVVKTYEEFAAPPPPVPRGDENFLVHEILVEKIHVDPTIQSREGGTNPEKVEEYKEAMLAGDVFPPVRLYWDGVRYWLSRGFHRVPAAVAAGKAIISCEVFEGGRREALLDSIASNTRHGLPRSHADKRRAVRLILEDEEWTKWSDGVIAKRVGVSQPFVSKLRRELTQNVLSQPHERVGADGRLIDTSDIGRRSQEEDAGGETGAANEPGAPDASTQAETPHTEPPAPDEAASRVWKPDDVAAVVRERGKLTRLQLEEMGCGYYTVMDAVSRGLVAQAEVGVFTPPAELGMGATTENSVSGTDDGQPSDMARKGPAIPAEKRPSFEALLKDRTLVVTYTYMSYLPGKVSVGVRVGDDATEAAYDTLDAARVRLGPERVLEMIAERIESAGKRPAKPKTQSPTKTSAGTAKAKSTAAKKSAGKAASTVTKKALAKRAATKVPAKKGKAAKGKAAAARRS